MDLLSQVVPGTPIYGCAPLSHVSTKRHLLGQLPGSWGDTGSPPSAHRRSGIVSLPAPLRHFDRVLLIDGDHCLGPTGLVGRVCGAGFE